MPPAFGPASSLTSFWSLEKVPREGVQAHPLFTLLLLAATHQTAVLVRSWSKLSEHSITSCSTLSCTQQTRNPFLWRWAGEGGHQTNSLIWLERTPLVWARRPRRWQSKDPSSHEPPHACDVSIFRWYSWRLREGPEIGLECSSADGRPLQGQWHSSER